MPRLHNLESIKAMKVTLGGSITRLKMSPWRSSKRSVDVISRGNKAMIAKGGLLGFLDFPKTSGKRRN